MPKRRGSPSVDAVKARRSRVEETELSAQQPVQTGGHSQSRLLQTGSTYRVSVETGDRPKAGNDANVYIVLHGEGKRSEEKQLNVSFENDFERGQLHTFDFNDIPFSTIDYIEVWNDTVGIPSDWNIDKITVDNIHTGEMTVFPVFRSILPNNKLKIIPRDTILPQHDDRKEQRQTELEEKRRLYDFYPPEPGLPCRIKVVPQDEKFSFSPKFDIRKKLLDLNRHIKKPITPRWKTLDDVKNIYNSIFSEPADTERWRDDVKFGYQRLAGVNNVVIQLCTEIPEKFGVTAKMVQPFLEGLTLSSALQQKRIFIIDYKILVDCPVKKDHIVCSPVALFFVRGDKKLVPIAIQLFNQKANDNPVFLPSDPKYTWILAKMWFNNADANFHQSVTHLGYTHLVMEGIVIITHRNLSQSHPIFKLLAPHFLYLIAINSLADTTLLPPGGVFDQTFPVGSKGVLELVRRRKPTWRLDVDGTIPEDFKARGVDDPDVLPNYSSRDDALLLFDAIKKYVNKYVYLYYETNDALLADDEIQNWRKEMVETKGKGLGLLGVPGNRGKFTTREQLAFVLTSFISTFSVSHAMANFAQYDEYCHPLNYPSLLRGSPPRDKRPLTEDDVVASLPDKKTHFVTMVTTKILSERGTKSLGDFEVNYVFDKKALDIVNEFREDLKKAGKTIREHSQKRKPPYPFLDPAEVPNSISI